MVAGHWENLRGLQNGVLKEKRISLAPKEVQREGERERAFHAFVLNRGHIDIFTYQHTSK